MKGRQGANLLRFQSVLTNLIRIRKVFPVKRGDFRPDTFDPLLIVNQACGAVLGSELIDSCRHFSGRASGGRSYARNFTNPNWLRRAAR
jgi:hypothetical protein